MKIDYRRLRAVVWVADELSFSRAAERLNVTQPALSAQIRNLERDLGFEVFDRSTRRVSLTGNGRRFLEEARRVVGESERLERFVRVVRRETLTQLAIGTAIYTIDMPERVRVLEGLIEACPDIKVDIVTGSTQTDLAGELAAGHLDLAILMGMPIPGAEYRRVVAEHAGRESLFDDGLRRVVLRRQSVDLLVPAELPLARRRTVSARDLAGQRVAVFHAYHGEHVYRPLAEFLHEAGAELVLPPEPNAIGVERYGRKFRIPAVTLGWFPQPNDGRMVRRCFAGLDLHTELVLAGHPDISTPAVERAYAFARQLSGA